MKDIDLLVCPFSPLPSWMLNLSSSGITLDCLGCNQQWSMHPMAPISGSWWTTQSQTGTLSWKRICVHSASLSAWGRNWPFRWEEEELLQTHGDLNVNLSRHQWGQDLHISCCLKKLDKGQFIELYYWTNDGLEETLSLQSIVRWWRFDTFWPKWYHSMD
jgi:hypothetical protein